MNFFIKAIIAITFVFVNGLYLAYAFSPSIEFLIKIILTMLVGVALGLIVAFKLDKQKTEYLTVFAFLLALTSGLIFTMMIGKDIRLSNVALFTPDEYSIALKGIIVVAGIMGFISGCLLCIALKNFTNHDKKGKTNSYLVCNDCGKYYQLQPGESPDDFSDECECGGKLEFCESIDEI